MNNEGDCPRAKYFRSYILQLEEQAGGMESSDVMKFKDLEEDNSRLKRMYAELGLDHSILKHVITKRNRPCKQRKLAESIVKDYEVSVNRAVK